MGHSKTLTEQVLNSHAARRRLRGNKLKGSKVSRWAKCLYYGILVNRRQIGNRSSK